MESGSRARRIQGVQVYTPEILSHRGAGEVCRNLSPGVCSRPAESLLFVPSGRKGMEQSIQKMRHDAGIKEFGDRVLPL